MAAAVIGVHGKYGSKSESEVEHYAERVAIESCTLVRSGKFMWDYGYLWQIVTFPEAYQPWEVERALKYFRTDLMRDVSFEGDFVRLDNTKRPIAISASEEPKDAITFLGADLPKSIVRGRQYFVVDSEKNFIRIADRPGGAAIRFEEAKKGMLAFNLSGTYLGAYAPTGSGPPRSFLQSSCQPFLCTRACGLPPPALTCAALTSILPPTLSGTSKRSRSLTPVKIDGQAELNPCYNLIHSPRFASNVPQIKSGKKSFSAVCLQTGTHHHGSHTLARGRPTPYSSAFALHTGHIEEQGYKNL